MRPNGAAAGVTMPAGVARRPVAGLVPAARNARTHSAAQVAAIAASVVEYGFNNPVLVDEAGGIIAGHGRVLAAQQLGLRDVPVVVLGHLDATQRRAYLLADNRLAELAGWDEGALGAELRDLAALDVDLGVLGFAGPELEALLREPAVAVDGRADEAPPAPQRPVSRLGDVWLCGRHRLVCGNAATPAVRAQALGGAAVDVVITDPPYGVAYQSRVDVEFGRKDWGPILGDEGGGGPRLRRLLRTAVPRKVRAMYVCAAWESLADFTAALGAPKTVCVWIKPTFGLGKGYRRQHELVLFYGAFRRGDLSDVWRFERAADYRHPTQKPVALVAKALADIEATAVFDPFVGSGTALIAAEQLGRTCHAIELDPRYVDVAVQRWETYSGRVPQLQGGGPFAAVAEARRRGADHAS